MAAFAVCGGEPARCPAMGSDPAAPMTVTGRVLDPQGKPVPHAAVMVLARSKLSDRRLPFSAFDTTTAFERRCDGSGSFRIELPRTSSARHHALTAVALAPGYGLGWAELDPDAESPTADVALRPEQIIRGRLFDLKGHPAGGVRIAVRGASYVARGELVSIARYDANERPWLDSPAWPAAAISDDDGRFTLRGLGRGPNYSLSLDDPRFIPYIGSIRTDDGAAIPGRLSRYVGGIRVEPGPDPKPITIAIQPARSLTGRVTDADTGRPVPHTLVGTLGMLRSEADGDGRFRVAARGAGARGDRFLIRAASPDGAPYLVAEKEGEWPKGALEQSVDLALTRGVVVRGKVVEESTGRPVAGAIVRIAPYRSPQQIAGGSCVPAATGPDGTYRVAAPPGPGYLVVQASDEYALREFGGDGDPSLIEAEPGHRRFYAHAYRAVDLKPGGPDQEVDIALRRGATVRGRVVGPDGQPVPDARVFSRIILRTNPVGGWRDFVVSFVGLVGFGRGRVYDGRFALHGLDADVEVPVFFLEPERKLGATVRFTGRSATGGPVTVRLQPCGTARARLVDPEGKPVDRYRAQSVITMIVTPGSMHRRKPAKDDPLFADTAALYELDPVNHTIDAQSDTQGRVAFPALIPGATYLVVDRSAFYAGGEQEIRKEFTVKPGEAAELGDILIARPGRRN
jgi:protocatechuate 3,4-dioxygenase beta subunit